MIWFILGVIVVPLTLAILWYKFGMMDVNDWEDIFFTWFVGAFFGVIAALIINLVLGIVLPDKTYDQTYELATTPTIVQTELGLEVLATTTDRQNFFEGGNNLVFENSNDNTVTIRDYVVYNGWLCAFNYADNDMILRIPESEKISLGG